MTIAMNSVYFVASLFFKDVEYKLNHKINYQTKINQNTISRRLRLNSTKVSPQKSLLEKT